MPVRDAYIQTLVVRIAVVFIDIDFVVVHVSFFAKLSHCLSAYKQAWWVAMTTLYGVANVRYMDVHMLGPRRDENRPGTTDQCLCCVMSIGSYSQSQTAY